MNRALASNFSLGLIFYEMINREYPTELESSPDDFEPMLGNLQYNAMFDDFNVNRVLKGLLRADPKKRMKLDEALDLLWEEEDMVNFGQEE